MYIYIRDICEISKKDMHFIVQDICNQNACLILVTLQWLNNSTVPNGVTIFTEKSKTFKTE